MNELFGEGNDFWILFGTGMILLFLLSYFHVFGLKEMRNRLALRIAQMNPQVLRAHPPQVIRFHRNVHRSMGLANVFLACTFLLVASKVLDPKPSFVIFLPGGLLPLYFLRTAFVVKLGDQVGFLDKLSRRIMLYGSYDLIETWIQVMGEERLKGPHMLAETHDLHWGSWHSAARLSQHKPSLHNMQFLTGIQANVEIRNGISQLEESLTELKSQDFDFRTLDKLADRYWFWQRLMEEFEVGKGIAHLREMEAGEGPFKSRLLELLVAQKRALEAYPDVYCPQSRRRPHMMGLKHARIVECDSGNRLDMVTGIKQVVGLIGSKRKQGQDGEVWYYPIWDETKKKAYPAPVSKVIVSDDFQGNLDWAVTAVWEAQENSFPGEVGKIELELPEGVGLQDNTQRMLERYRKG